MKPATLIACICLAAPALQAVAQHHESGSETQHDAKPVNAMCPIGKEPIVPSAGTVEYKGKTIGLCCPGCGKAFLAWDESRRDGFVALAMRGAEPGQAHQDSSDESATSQPAALSFPYPLGTCIVSDEKLGSMGEPVTLKHEGRDITLCCRGCVKEFEAEPAKFIVKLDKAIIDAQLMHYPIDTCIVAGGKLGSMGEPVNFVYNNRLIRFCCAGCEKGFKDDPAKYLKALDKEIIEQQTKTYPLTTCVVTGAELGSMGVPVDYVFGNRLVRFCCAGCIKKFEAEPVRYMATVDKAYADAQRDSYPRNTCVVAGGELGSMGEPVELVAGTRLVRFCCEACLPAFKKDPQKYLAKLTTE
jgi:YHS domain-containing protein